MKKCQALLFSTEVLWVSILKLPFNIRFFFIKTDFFISFDNEIYHKAGKMVLAKLASKYV